jgi:hypothetical protein
MLLWKLGLSLRKAFFMTPASTLQQLIQIHDDSPDEVNAPGHALAWDAATRASWLTGRRRRWRQRSMPACGPGLMAAPAGPERKGSALEVLPMPGRT